jgi:hypothetical protein
MSTITKVFLTTAALVVSGVWVLGCTGVVLNLVKGQPLGVALVADVVGQSMVAKLRGVR